MIQFNLLPDVKMAYMKTQRTKRRVTFISIITAGASLAVLTILFVTVQGVQRKSLSDVSKDISKEMQTLKSVEDLDKILTVQNQLSSLTALHEKKPVATRLLGYVSSVTPSQAKISNLNVDFVANTITIAGTADSLITVNKFADSLKFATYSTSTTENGKPFTAVVTTTALATNGNKASYSLSFSFDPILFLASETPKLTVPSIVSNRSETEKPTSIFKADPKKDTAQ